MIYLPSLIRQLSEIPVKRDLAPCSAHNLNTSVKVKGNLFPVALSTIKSKITLYKDTYHHLSNQTRMHGLFSQFKKTKENDQGMGGLGNCYLSLRVLSPCQCNEKY